MDKIIGHEFENGPSNLKARAEADAKRPPDCTGSRWPMMNEADNRAIVEKLGGLRTELIDLAYSLECKGRMDAADLAVATAARIAELCDEFAGSRAILPMANRSSEHG